MNSHHGAYQRAVKRLGKPGSKLVLTFSSTHRSGRAYYILPQGKFIADETAQAILRRPDLKVVDAGLLPGRPQSWCLGRS